MPRGKGVRLQRYKDGGLADAKTFGKKDAAHLCGLRDAELHALVGGTEGLVGRARAGRPPAAEGLPQIEQLRAAVLDQPLTDFVMPGLVPGIHD